LSQGITLNIPPGSIREVRPNGPNGSAEEAAAGAGQGQIPIAFAPARERRSWPRFRYCKRSISTQFFHSIAIMAATSCRRPADRSEHVPACLCQFCTRRPWRG
jgi:hypothetical protein